MLDDGRRIALEGLVLLGRNPQPKAGEEDAQLIKIADETRTVSKSHLAVGTKRVVSCPSTADHQRPDGGHHQGILACRAGEMVRGDGAIGPL